MLFPHPGLQGGPPEPPTVLPGSRRKSVATFEACVNSGEMRLRHPVLKQANASGLAGFGTGRHLAAD